jgi:hypothetical protein
MVSDEVPDDRSLGEYGYFDGADAVLAVLAEALRAPHDEHVGDFRNAADWIEGLGEREPGALGDLARIKADPAYEALRNAERAVDLAREQAEVWKAERDELRRLLAGSAAATGEAPERP